MRHGALTDYIVSEAASEDQIPEPMPAMEWRVQLWRRNPARLPILLAAIVLASLTVLVVFQSALLALATVLLLVGATSEYLFPVTYRVTSEGVFSNVLLNRLALKWNEMRRCASDGQGVLLTPLEFPSRGDGFRGVFLRFAPDGQPGDKASILAQVAHYVPHLIATDANEEENHVRNGLGRASE